MARARPLRQRPLAYCGSGVFVASGAQSGRARPFPVQLDPSVRPMKVRNSLKSLRSRHRDNRVVRRKGRVYVINKTNRRFKARQG